MSTFDKLPVILVSASNEIAAKGLISELVDNDVTDDYLKDTQTQSPDRVWRLVNKYYTANVRVHALSDQGQLEVDPDSVEAHVLYISQEEQADEPQLAARATALAARAGEAWRRASVRAVLSEAAHEADALRAWAARRRAALVALREAGGLAAARAALHAHVWRGLVRTDRALPPCVPEASANSSCGSDDSACSEQSDSEQSDSEQSDSEAEERRAVEHAEAFAAALGALGPALAARAEGPAPGDAGAPELRRERAEALVLAFCRALGLDSDAC